MGRPRLVLLFARGRAARTPATAAPRGGAGRPLGLGRRSRRSRDRGRLGEGRRRRSIAPARAPAAAAVARCRRSRLLAGGRAQGSGPAVALDRRPDLAFGAQAAVDGVHVDPPHHDGRGGAAHGRPFLRQRPAGVDRVPGVDRTRELPVQPLPLGDRRDRRIDGAEADGHGHDERRGRRTRAVFARLDRQRGQVTGDAGKQRYLGFGDGAAARCPLAAEGKVVERKRLQIAPSIDPTRRLPR